MMEDSSQKPIDYFLNSFCIKLVTHYLIARNFAVMYLYKEIEFKPNHEVYMLFENEF